MRRFFQASCITLLFTLVNLRQFQTPSELHYYENIMNYLRKTMPSVAPSDFTVRPPKVNFNDLHLDPSTGKLQFLLEIETSYDQRDLDWTTKKELNGISSISLLGVESRGIWAPRWSVRNKEADTIKEVLRITSSGSQNLYEQISGSSLCTRSRRTVKKCPTRTEIEQETTVRRRREISGNGTEDVDYSNYVGSPISYNGTQSSERTVIDDGGVMPTETFMMNDTYSGDPEMINATYSFYVGMMNETVSSIEGPIFNETFSSYVNVSNEYFPYFDSANLTDINYLPNMPDMEAMISAAIAEAMGGGENLTGMDAMMSAAYAQAMAGMPDMEAMISAAIAEAMGGGENSTDMDAMMSAAYAQAMAGMPDMNATISAAIAEAMGGGENSTGMDAIMSAAVAQVMAGMPEMPDMDTMMSSAYAQAMAGMPDIYAMKSAAFSEAMGGTSNMSNLIFGENEGFNTTDIGIANSTRGRRSSELGGNSEYETEYTDTYDGGHSNDNDYNSYYDPTDYYPLSDYYDYDYSYFDYDYYFDYYSYDNYYRDPTENDDGSDYFDYHYDDYYSYDNYDPYAKEDYFISDYTDYYDYTYYDYSYDYDYDDYVYFEYGDYNDDYYDYYFTDYDYYDYDNYHEYPDDDNLIIYDDHDQYQTAEGNDDSNYYYEDIYRNDDGSDYYDYDYYPTENDDGSDYYDYDYYDYYPTENDGSGYHDYDYDYDYNYYFNYISTDDNTEPKDYPDYFGYYDYYDYDYYTPYYDYYDYDSDPHFTYSSSTLGPDVTYDHFAGETTEAKTTKGDTSATTAPRETSTMAIVDDDDDVNGCYDAYIPVMECPIKLVSSDLKFLDAHVDVGSEAKNVGHKVWDNGMMTSVEYGSQSIKITVVVDLS